VARSRLLDKLQEILTHRLTLLSAPVGFGKTTLLAECIRARDKGRIAWFSLDGGDNDPARLWAYLLAALQSVDAGLGEKANVLYAGSSSTAFEPPLTVLINEIDTQYDDLVLVLDDYHVIENPVIHQALSARAPPRADAPGPEHAGRSADSSCAIASTFSTRRAARPRFAIHVSLRGDSRRRASEPPCGLFQTASRARGL
jgi:hypothetical protein